MMPSREPFWGAAGLGGLGWWGSLPTRRPSRLGCPRLEAPASTVSAPQGFVWVNFPQRTVRQAGPTRKFYF